MRAHQAGRPHCRRSASRTQQASRQQRTVQEQRTSHRDPNRNGNSDDAAADYGVRARRESRSQHQLHSGGALPMHNMHAFSVVVTRHSMVVLVETSRARCRSDTPRAPVHPTGCAMCRPYRRLSRCCTYTACTFGCTPSRRGGGARPRCRQGERPHSGRSRSACTGPPARPASMFALRRSPGGSYRGPGGVLRAGGPPPRRQVAQ